MKIVEGVTYILLLIMKILSIITLVGFFQWSSGLFYNFGIIGLLLSIAIGIVIVFHFCFVFPKKFEQIFAPTPSKDEIAKNKQEKEILATRITLEEQGLISDCFYRKISREEIDERLDQIILEKEILKKYTDVCSTPSKKFTLHSPQNSFQRDNPVLYTALILSTMGFACVLFFYYFCWVFSGYSPSEEVIPSDSYEYETEPELWMDMDDAVYISNTGKIHLTPDCSGMENYDEMTYEEACETGYSHCSRCFD